MGLTLEEAQAATERIYKRLDARRGEIDRLENYYVGKHNLTFATDAWMEANKDRYKHFSDNWCAPVSNAAAERIQVNGILLPSDGDVVAVQDAEAGPRKRTPAEDALWGAWLDNEMDAQSSQGFLQSLNTRTSYVLVWSGEEDGEPEITWEHPASVEIEYDWMTRRRRRFAVKSWVEDEWEYATLYTPEEVWKFQRERDGGKPEETLSQSAQGKAPTGATGEWAPRVFPAGYDDAAYGPNPLGVVPIVEVPNRPLLKGQPVSEIELVAALQDAVNILWAYCMFAADYASMEARVLLGAAPPMRRVLDDDGNELPPVPVTMKDLNEARFAIFGDPDAKIDSWKAAQLDPFTDVIEVAVSHIAAQTRTPPHYLVTNQGLSNLAADALKAAEIGLVKKCEEFQLFASASMREVFRLVALVRGDENLAKQIRRATVSWKNPEIRSESQLADALLKKKQMGYPLEWLMEQDGIDPADRKRIKQMIAEEEQARNLAAVSSVMRGVVEDDGVGGGTGADVPDGPGAIDGADRGRVGGSLVTG